MTDTNATYSTGTGAEARVRLHGERNGFRYVEFEDGTATKVPAAWVTPDAHAGTQPEEAHLGELAKAYDQGVLDMARALQGGCEPVNPYRLAISQDAGAR